MVKGKDESVDMWAELDQDFNKRTKPEGTFSIPEYAGRYNISDSQARGAVERLERMGKIEFVGRFGLRNAKHYKLK